MKPTIKICGLTQQHQIEILDEMGVDYLGFIFWNASPRAYQSNLKPFKKSAKHVGVFVNENWETIFAKVAQFDLDIVQLHGSESVAYCDYLTSQGLRVWKALPPETTPFAITQNYAQVTEYILWEHQHTKVGGSGFSFDWELLTQQPKVDFVLSGGLGLDNASAIQAFCVSDLGKKCRGLDFNSKLELEPGIKDIALVAELISCFKKTTYEYHL